MTTTARAKRRKSAPAGPRYSRLHAPPGMAPQAWQIALRRQFGRESSFSLENLGSEPIFSEFRVVNPASGGRYRVALRGARQVVVEGGDHTPKSFPEHMPLILGFAGLAPAERKSPGAGSEEIPGRG